MAVGGSGLSALFWVEPITPGDTAAWLTDGVLKDGGNISISIGASIVGGTPGSVLFVGAGSVIAQDNANFFWDDTNHILKLEGPGQLQVYNVDDHAGNFERGVLDWVTTSNILTVGVPPSGVGGTGVLRDVRYYSAGIPALYRIPNASGDNWFEGGAGNTTLTGFSNFGTGPGALANLTSGQQNFAVGPNCLHAATDSVQNVAMGNTIFLGGLHLVQCVGLGFNIGGNIGNNSSGFQFNNTLIGVNLLTLAQTGNDIIAIGSNVLSNNGATIDFNVLIGSTVLDSASASTTKNTVIGAINALHNVSAATQCTVIGCWSGPSAPLSNVIALADGSSPTAPQLDWSYTNANVWSHRLGTTAQGIHVYNTSDGLAPPTNYERGALSWIDTANTFRIESQAGGTGTVRIIAIDGFQKAGAPAAGDLPSGTWGLINDTSGGNTWLVYNNSGTIRKVQLV